MLKPEGTMKAKLSNALVATIAILAAGVWNSDQAMAQPACNTPTGPFCNAGISPPSGWGGHVFQLSQNYPNAPVNDGHPWTQYDPRTQSGPYLKAVLAYFFEDNIHANIESDFDPTLNHTRGWYNAPWQDVGLNGREFIHGLTRERVSRAGELDPHQMHPWNNYAVGFYNATGAATIGRVWHNHGAPDSSAGLMPEGAVAAKLLFTTAPVSEVPYLVGAPEWSAYIYSDVNNPAPPPGSPRAVIKVRLLQIDVAVKDSRVGNTTGWVFGTFVYGGGPGGPVGSGWTNVAPVGVMWGNDPSYTGSGPLTETVLNSSVHMPHVGYQGRLNGPVDNSISSCLSCHSTAEDPAGTMVPPAGQNPTPWFRNIPSGTPFDAGRHALDYSLQLSVGISNFNARQALMKASTQDTRMKLKRALLLRGSQRPPRDGGVTH
jgi:hypothetical protein